MEARYKKKSIFSMGGILENLSSETDNQFKFAMYNGLATIAVLLAMVVTYGVYCILQPFIKPLVWALIWGSVLHPFKQIISDKVRTQITKLESDSKPISLNVICIPFSLISTASDGLGNGLLEHKWLLIKSVGSVCSAILLYFYTPQFIIQLNSIFFNFSKLSLFLLLDIFDYSPVFIAVVILYISCLILFWQPGTEIYFYGLNIILWIATSAWFSNFFGYLRLALFVFLQFIPFSCCLYKISGYCDENVQDESPAMNSDKGCITTSDHISSMQVIRWISYACFCIVVISIPSFLYIVLILLAVYVLKYIYFTFGIADVLKMQYEMIKENVSSWFIQRKKILYPAPLNDTFTAYKEGVYLIQVGGDIINKTIISNPEVHQLLPDDWKSTTETALENAYIYAREFITKMVRSALKSRGISEEKGMEIENGALELWDRAYQAWVMPIQPRVGPSVTPDAVLSSCYSFLERLQKTPEVMSVEWIKDLVLENMAALNSGLNSAWLILKGNMSLLLNLLSTLISILFGGGISLINFTLHMIVFLTALFYLLSSSREVYKPVEIITQLSPKYGKRLALAVENSCQEVLAASAKLSAFYGLWTWLIHKVFQSNLSYMPAVFAGILGVVPFLGTYWACLPAFLDLWFVQESKIRAVGLFIAQIFPTMIVETAVYREIEGGHPYLTGLSVAGGMFWLGVEGVIAGPLLLCFLFVTLDMLSAENVSDDRVNNLKVS
nr:transmembrane protein 245 [Halyomorpha halys]